MAVLYDGRSGYDSPEYKEYHELIAAGMATEANVLSMFGGDKYNRLVQTKALRPAGYDLGGRPYYQNDEVMQHSQFRSVNKTSQGCCACCGHCPDPDVLITRKSMGSNKMLPQAAPFASESSHSNLDPNGINEEVHEWDDDDSDLPREVSPEVERMVRTLKERFCQLYGYWPGEQDPEVLRDQEEQEQNSSIRGERLSGDTLEAFYELKRKAQHLGYRG